MEETINSCKSSDVRDFIKQFVEISKVYKVDDDSIIHYTAKGKDEIWTIPVKDENIPVAIYDVNQKHNNVIVVNPFVEGLSTSDELLWFYNTRNIDIAMRISTIIKSMMVHILKIKEKESEEDVLPTEAVKLISPYVEDIDVKMVEEFSLLYRRNIHNLFNIVWNSKNRTCFFRSGIFEEEFKKSFDKKIRVKSWNIFKDILTDMLKTSNPKEDIRIKSDHPGCARIDSYSRIYYKLLMLLKPYSAFIPDHYVDLDKFKEHIDRIPFYYSRAKSLITPRVSNKKPTTKEVPPWEVPEPDHVPSYGNAVPHAQVQFDTPNQNNYIPENNQNPYSPYSHGNQVPQQPTVVQNPALQPNNPFGVPSNFVPNVPNVPNQPGYPYSPQQQMYDPMNPYSHMPQNSNPYNNPYPPNMPPNSNPYGQMMQPNNPYGNPVPGYPPSGYPNNYPPGYNPNYPYPPNMPPNSNPYSGGRDVVINSGVGIPIITNEDVFASKGRCPI